MRRERRKIAYWITAAISLAIGLVFIWPRDFEVWQRLLFIAIVMLWMQITVWFSIRRRRSYGRSRSSSAKSQSVL